MRIYKNAEGEVMEALYTVKNKYTYEEYRKFSYYCSWYSSRVTIAVCIVIMLGFLVNSIIKGYILPISVVVAFFVGFPFFIEYSIKKAYKTHKAYEHEVTIRFFEEFIEGEVANSTTKVLYKNLYKTVETKTSFFIMMGNNQGFLVIKENCTEELCEFIRKLKD